MNPLPRPKLVLPTVLLVALLASGASPWRSGAAAAGQPRLRADDPTLTPVPPHSEATSLAVQRLLSEAARQEGIPAERLQVGHYERVELPLTGVAFDYAKVIDSSTGAIYGVAIDASGKVVDAEQLRSAERAAFRATYGKLYPSLAEHLQSLSPRDKVRVAIWLKMGGRDASIPRPSKEDARALGAESVRQLKAAGRARAAQIHREVQQPLLERLPGLGGSVIGTADTAPLVFAEVPAASVQELANLPYVDSIGLLVEGGPEQLGESEEKSLLGPELALARRVHKADIVEARGITGAGITAAVIEGGSIEFANPFLADGTCGPTSSCPGKTNHATAIGGIIASTHDSVRGVAPGVGSNLLSGNGGGWTLANHQAATSWAITQGASVLNHSYFLGTNGTMEISDRWLDYVVRANWDFVVKSAGNRGDLPDAHVTNPGLGYNVLTVGAVEDKGTLTWDDDTMGEFSSWRQQDYSDQFYKPEVSAVGCGEWTSGSVVIGITSTTTSSPWLGNQGCGTSYAAPIATAAGALLIQRDPGLEVAPEAVKAILIATALQNVEGNSRWSNQDGAGSIDLAAADTLAANGWWASHYLTGSSFVGSG